MTAMTIVLVLLCLCLPVVTESSVAHISMALPRFPMSASCLMKAMPFLTKVHTPCAAPRPQVRALGGLACAL